MFNKFSLNLKIVYNNQNYIEHILNIVILNVKYFPYIVNLYIFLSIIIIS